MNIWIRGYSNLGADLCKEAIFQGHRVCIDTKYTELFNPDIIINTIGGCAGGGDLTDPRDLLWHQNIDENLRLRREYPKAKLIAFSSNSAMEPWRTYYGSIKRSLEEMSPSNNITVFRIGNLYGDYKPEKCFPYKLIQNNPDSLPDNPIIPMPTKWLAKGIISNLGSLLCGPNILAPSGKTTVREWGELILGRPLKSSGLTEDRNQKCIITGDGPDWRVLWGEYGVPNLLKGSGKDP